MAVRTFACVLGQEMAGYATGEVYLHLPGPGTPPFPPGRRSGYSYDQKQKGKDAAQAVEFLVQDEKSPVLLTSMVSCLFAREVYKEAVLAECLSAVGYRNLAENVDAIAQRVQKMRWQIRVKTGFDPGSVKIPERFKQVVTWKGPLDSNYLDSLQKTYAQRIREMATSEEGSSARLGSITRGKDQGQSPSEIVPEKE